MSNYAIFRVAKLKQGYGKNSIGRAWRHLSKHSECAEISRPERTHLNQTKMLCSDYREEVRKAIEKHNEVSKKKLRSDASIGFECIFTYSPEMEGKISPQDFYDRIMKFYNKNFASLGATPLLIQFDADETVSHFHLISICSNPETDKINVAEVLGNKARLSELQSDFALMCADIGLSRGNCYTGQKEKPKHITLKQHKAQQIKEIKQLEMLKKKMQSDLDLSR